MAEKLQVFWRLWDNPNPHTALPQTSFVTLPSVRKYIIVILRCYLQVVYLYPSFYRLSL